MSTSNKNSTAPIITIVALVAVAGLILAGILTGSQVDKANAAMAEMAETIRILEENNRELEQSMVPVRFDPTPTLVLSTPIESQCLAIGVYYESRNTHYQGMVDTAWMIVNRAIDGRHNEQFKPSICSVLNSPARYESMKAPQRELLRKLVWGEVSHVKPKFAGPEDEAAWNDIVGMVDRLMAGELSRSTIANHFLSLKGMAGRPVPSWAADLRPIGVSATHILFVDYMDTVDGRVYFTKDNPYTPSMEKEAL